ncbi:MAG: sigma 54-interacting transcriptional regulator [Bacteroidia bacterium]
MNIEKIKTLGQLRGQGYKPKGIKDELRANLIKALRNRESPFAGIYGYEDTVIPEMERAILARHNILLLGLRGQAKTRLARLMVELLDEYIPVIDGAELYDDPMNPITRYGIDRVDEEGDRTPVSWVHRTERYTEKLATPDVSVADLIGDIDPIKAANMRLHYADERVIHYGLIPRAHRGIFVINELPDLQARIQVSLFNILQEGDIQIRGFKLRLPLDLQFVFTANPEDYTNRGSIVTPLKDRIESQILTHYPKDIQTAGRITKQESQLRSDQWERVQMADLMADLVEQIGFEARGSEFVDQKSGVSARLSISAYEQLVSAAERRALRNGTEMTKVRIADLFAVIPAITGKIELVYEGEQEGPALVARNLIKKAIRSFYPLLFPDPEELKKQGSEQVYQPMLDWFAEGNSLDLWNEASDGEYSSQLALVPGLEELVNRYQPGLVQEHDYLLRELVLHGLAEYSLFSKQQFEGRVNFRDLLGSMFRFDDEK